MSPKPTEERKEKCPEFEVIELDKRKRKMTLLWRSVENFMTDLGDGFFVPNHKYALLATTARDLYYAPSMIELFEEEFYDKYKLWTKHSHFDFKKTIYLEKFKKIYLSIELIEVKRLSFVLNIIFYSEENEILVQTFHEIIVCEKKEGLFVFCGKLSSLENKNLKSFLSL